MSDSLKKLLIYSAGVLLLSSVYFAYVYFQAPASVEHETFLSEIGEGVGEIGMWALMFIYARTLLKLTMGKGPISRRLLPNYTPPPQASWFAKLLTLLDRTHVHVGIAAVAIIALHVLLMGVPLDNLFFWAVIGLLIWQTAFGMFLRWRGAPRDVKKFSYSVHAQLLTGVMMGIFALFGHGLV